MRRNGLPVLPALVILGLALAACTPVPATAPAPDIGWPESGPATTPVPTIQAPTFTPSPTPPPIVVGAQRTALAVVATPTQAATPTTAPPLPGIATPGPLPGPSATPPNAP